MGLSSLKWEILPLLRIWDNIGVGNSEKISIEKVKIKKAPAWGTFFFHPKNFSLFNLNFNLLFLSFFGFRKCDS